MTIHKSVLLEETVDALDLREGMIVVDATVGGGGHSLKVLEKIGKKGTLVAFDQDQHAIDRFRKKVKDMGVEKKDCPQILLVNDNFSSLKDSLSLHGIDSVDAILADLGISSDQLDDPGRGLSFRVDGPLDMRLDLRESFKASNVVNEYSESQLAGILAQFADEPHARSIARAIAKERIISPIMRTSELVSIIEKSVPPKYRYQKIHCATRTFQALRMEVNKEKKHLEKFLIEAVDVLRPGGRLAIVTFHSGEDALVKKFLRENARGCICPPELPACRCEHEPSVQLLGKAIRPSDEEIKLNPRSRSARLRVAKKL